MNGGDPDVALHMLQNRFYIQRLRHLTASFFNAARSDLSYVTVAMNEIPIGVMHF